MDYYVIINVIDDSFRNFIYTEQIYECIHNDIVNVMLMSG